MSEAGSWQLLADVKPGTQAVCGRPGLQVADRLGEMGGEVLVLAKLTNPLDWKIAPLPGRDGGVTGIKGERRQHPLLLMRGYSCGRGCGSGRLALCEKFGEM